MTNATAATSPLYVRHAFALIAGVLLAIVRGAFAVLWRAFIAVFVLIVSGVVAMSAGYAFTDVASNSMEPTIVTGDYVLTRPYEDGDLSVGTILSYRDVRPDRTISITHRVIAVDNGQATMKGDHNEAADAKLVGADDVLGVVALKVDGDVVRKTLGALLAGGVLLLLLSPVERFLAWSAKRLA